MERAGVRASQAEVIRHAVAGNDLLGARARLLALRSALAEQRDLREVFLALFPEGLTFTPARTPNGERQIWEIEGAASFAALLGGGSGPDCVATPTGIEPVCAP